MFYFRFFFSSPIYKARKKEWRAIYDSLHCSLLNWATVPTENSAWIFSHHTLTPVSHSLAFSFYPNFNSKWHSLSFFLFLRKINLIGNIDECSSFAIAQVSKSFQLCIAQTLRKTLSQAIFTVVVAWNEFERLITLEWLELDCMCCTYIRYVLSKQSKIVSGRWREWLNRQHNAKNTTNNNHSEFKTAIYSNVKVNIQWNRCEKCSLWKIRCTVKWEFVWGKRRKVSCSAGDWKWNIDMLYH